MNLKIIKEFKEKIEDSDDELDKLPNSIIELSVYNISDELTMIEYKYEENSVTVYAQNTNNNSIIEVVIHTSEDEDDMIIKMNNEYADNSSELTYSISMDSKEYKIILKTTDNGDDITTNISIEGEELDEIKKALTITNTIRFKNIKFSELDEDNSITINDLSESELQKLLTEIQENFTKSMSGDSKSFIGFIYNSIYGSYMNSGLNDYDFTYNFEDDENGIMNGRDNLLDENVENDEKIQEETEKIRDEIEKVITKLLDEYHEENLTEERIVSGCTYAKASIIDGNTIKSVKGDNVYYTKITIDGSDWTLTSVETTYSESGEME